MSDLTIEQLEALREGTTPGPWMLIDIGEITGWNFEILGQDPERPAVFPSICSVEHSPEDARLIAAAPELVDALIAERQAHQKLREDIEAMREDWELKAERSASARDNSEHPAKAAHARHLKSHQHVIQRLTDILEGYNK